MSIVHITTGANYNVTKPFIKFIDTNFEKGEHLILVVDEKTKIPKEILGYENVVSVDKTQRSYKIKLFNLVKDKDRIILHSLWMDMFTLIFLILKPKMMEKIYWVGWGKDLYQWESTKKGLHYRFRNFVFCKFRKKIKHYVGIFPPDIDYFNDQFGSNARTYYAPYIGIMATDEYRNINVDLNLLKKKIDNNETINILVGHSSNPVLNHFEVLRNLKKFKNQNIMIYIPLSYGNEDYGNKIEQKAYEYFGDKVVCIKNMMETSAYYDLLNNMDVAIFNTNRQIGLGNISPLLYMNKKIYMPDNSVMYKYYTSKAVEISDYNDVEKMSFNDFITPLQSDAGQQYITKNELDVKQQIKQWAKVFQNDR